MRQINFLEENLRKSALQAKQDRKYFFGSGIALLVVIVLWLGFLIYNSILLEQTKDIKAQAEALENELLSFSTYQIDYLTFIAKVKGISEIIALRNNAVPLMTYAAEYLTQEGVYLSMINYSMQEKAFTINLSIDNVFYVEQLYLSMLDPDFRAKFKGIDYTSLSRAQSGIYSTSFTFNL